VNDTGNEMILLIHELSLPDSARRASAAEKIFQRGRELAKTATQKWPADHELLSCFVGDASGFPEATVGLAVEPSHFENIRAANGSPALADVPPDQDAKEFEMEFAGGVRLDILTTRQPEGSGPMARFLRKFGEGIQQVELLASDVDRATELLRARFGLVPVFPATRPGAGGTRVNFFLVPLPEGQKLLIELVETRAAHA
jgi:hypothetical protein